MVSRTLAVQPYPDASLHAQSVTAAATIESGATVDVTVPGQLTIHETTLNADATVRLRLVSGQLQAAGATAVTMTASKSASADAVHDVRFARHDRVPAGARQGDVMSRAPMLALLLTPLVGWQPADTLSRARLPNVGGCPDDGSPERIVPALCSSWSACCRSATNFWMCC
jgi:hypothetical protein